MEKGSLHHQPKTSSFKIENVQVYIWFPRLWLNCYSHDKRNGSKSLCRKQCSIFMLSKRRGQAISKPFKSKVVFIIQLALSIQHFSLLAAKLNQFSLCDKQLLLTLHCNTASWLISYYTAMHYSQILTKHFIKIMPKFFALLCKASKMLWRSQ